MKKFVGLLVTAGLLAGCDHIGLGGPRVVGSGKKATDSRTVPAYKKVELRGAMDVVIDCGKDGKVDIEADDNILPIITTEVKDGTLIVSSKGSYTTSTPMKVHLQTAHLSSANLSGSGNLIVNKVEEPKLTLSLSGSGNFRAVGTVDSIDASLSGSGNFKLGELKSKKAEISISGSGDAEVNCTESLDASISGSGDIAYIGAPKDVAKSINGSGTIKPKS